MAAPSTYERIQEVPLAISFTWRGSYTGVGQLQPDAWAKNVYLEKADDGPYSVKRPGMGYITTLGSGSGAQYVQGAFSGKFSSVAAIIPWVIIGDTIYNGLNNAVHATIPLGSQISGAWYRCFQNYNSSTVPVTTMLQSYYGIYWATGSGTLAQVLVPNSGASLVPGIAELDNSWYVMDTNGLIWSTNPGQPGTWPALNFISTDAALVQPVALSRHQNYVVAFGANAVQLFYDAGISPGSLLAAVQGGVFLQGMDPDCAWTLAETDDALFWVGTSDAGNDVVFMLQGLQITKISTPSIERWIEANFQLSGTTNLASAIQIRGFTARVGGHTFYVLTALIPSSTITLGATLTYDLTSGEWCVWTQQSQYTNNYPAAVGTAGSGLAEGAVRAWGSVAVPGALPYLPDVNNGRMLQMNDNLYQDDGQMINVLLQTDLFSWGNQRTKIIPATYLLTDTLTTTLYLSWTDNDYQTFNTAQAFNGNLTKKQVIRCGSTIQRAWQVTHSDNTPMRFYQLEVEVVPGAL